MTNPLFATLSGTTSIHGKTSIHPSVIKTMGINWGITTSVSDIYICTPANRPGRYSSIAFAEFKHSGCVDVAVPWIFTRKLPQHALAKGMFAEFALALTNP